MSIIKSIKQVLGLSGTASENHFWDGSVPNQLSLKRGTPDAPGAELIKALNGVLSFPNQGQSLTGQGYIKLPGGLIMQWGDMPGADGSGFSSVNFPIQFPNNVLQATVSHVAGSRNPVVVNITSLTATAIQVGCSLSTTGAPAPAATAKYIAVGY